MNLTTSRLQLAELLKRFDEDMILTDELITVAYEFLFLDRLYLRVHGDLSDTLYYLKDIMAINKLTTLEDLALHYQAKLDNITTFLNDLIEPRELCTNEMYIDGNKVIIMDNTTISGSSMIDMLNTCSCLHREIRILDFNESKEHSNVLAHIGDSSDFYNQCRPERCNDDHEECCVG